MKPDVEEKTSPSLLYDRSFIDQGFKALTGVDEAGRGPLAGPVVAAAVIVRDFSFSARVGDSKKLSEKAREEAYEEILAKAVVGISVIDRDVIDRVNIFQATMQAMQEAVTKLGQTPDCILIDGPSVPKLPFKMVPVVDGDRLSFSIGCASIIAKVTRDRIMKYYDAMFPEYGFANHKGYGTEEHMAALRKHGPCRLHRQSFEPVRDALKAHGNTAYN